MKMSYYENVIFLMSYYEKRGHCEKGGKKHHEQNHNSVNNVSDIHVKHSNGMDWHDCGNF